MVSVRWDICVQKYPLPSVPAPYVTRYSSTLLVRFKEDSCFRHIISQEPRLLRNEMSVALSPLKTIDCTSEGESIIHIEYKTWLNAPFTGNIIIWKLMQCKTSLILL